MRKTTLMTQIFKSFFTIGRLRAIALSLPLAGTSLTMAACNSDSSVEPSAGWTPEAAPPSGEAPATESPAPAPPPSTTPTPAPPTPVGPGIPLGLFHMPGEDFDSVYNGAMQAAGPSYVLRNLEAIKARGGRVILSMTGGQTYVKDGNGHFSLAKWKARIDRLRGVNLSSYIEDGTILGHYLLDEPYDAHNFGGQAVGGALVEEMAKYSKSIWPNLPTIVRAEPYLVQWSGTYQYLDAAWAQYLHRKGDVKQYIAENVRIAQSMGLALVVGLNLHHGGVGNRPMTGNQILDWGSTLLSGSDPCAFISWKYNAKYLAQSDVQAAMLSLSDMAGNRPSRACHNG